MFDQGLEYIAVCYGFKTLLNFFMQPFPPYCGGGKDNYKR